MRLMIIAALLAAAGCASPAPQGSAPQAVETCPACGVGEMTPQQTASICPTCAAPPAAIEAYNRVETDNRRLGLTAPATPEERAKREREDALLERALTNSPDYTAALRRAAIANVDADTPAPPAGRRNRTADAAARERLITAEEARLSDAVELRRRGRLNQQAAQDRSARDQQAIATCQARGAQMEAAYYNPRSILNLDGMIEGQTAITRCINAYRQTGILP